MKIKKIVFIIISGVIIILIGLAIELSIRYYHVPIKKVFEYSTTASLIYNFDDEPKTVKVKVIGEKLHYYFNNNDDAIQGDILMNDVSIFGRDQDDNDKYDNNPYINGFYTLLHDSKYVPSDLHNKGICNRIVISKLNHAIVCSIVNDDGKDGLLVISKKPVNEVIKKINDEFPQLGTWLDKYLSFDRLSHLC